MMERIGNKARLKLSKAKTSALAIAASRSRKEAEALKTLAREAALGVAQMKQQADATRIQSEAIGLSVGAATAYIAAQTRIADALRAKQPLTEKDIAQIKVEAAALGEATQAAERARINDQIRTDRRTVLLSTDDVAIAQQLRGIYPDVSQALASSEAAAMRFNMSSATSRRPARI
ncbi:hypothetical protein [Bradyrhizobium australiense]|uniref:Uncharacterized protein n=1 Tax=Bradyrhizobium australiense TaxID=2721161 RepID=A0A7Y4GTD1_9BRAD|nr:hypothetical protein [Bradyrhizobium australiense]NOJ41374.1 hypothetical protein [Bradyrhizobium australiense]